MKLSWRRAMTSEDVSSLLRGISDGRCAKMIAFSADCKDGLIRPRDSLRIYLVNDGTMSLGDVGDFMIDARRVLNRKAEYYPMPSSTTRKDMQDMGCTIVYTART